MKHLYILMAAAVMLGITGCNYEEINTNPFEMTEEEGMMDGIATGGLITAMQRAVIPVGTQADDTDIINQYQIAYHLSADTWGHSTHLCQKQNARHGQSKVRRLMPS